MVWKHWDKQQQSIGGNEKLWSLSDNNFVDVLNAYIFDTKFDWTAQRAALAGERMCKIIIQ